MHLAHAIHKVIHEEGSYRLPRGLGLRYTAGESPTLSLSRRQAEPSPLEVDTIIRTLDAMGIHGVEVADPVQVGEHTVVRLSWAQLSQQETLL